MKSTTRTTHVERPLPSHGPVIGFLCSLLFLLSPLLTLSANSVVSWGRQVLPPGNELTPLMDISAGRQFNLGLRPDGTVVAWGANNYREATVPEDLNEVAAVAAGSTHALALRRDGTVVAWGDNGQEQAAVPPDLGTVTAISAGHQHSLALREDGTVVAWGANNLNQTDVPEELTDVTAISAGHFHNLALRRDGTVVGWGLDSDGQASVPPELTDVVAIAAGGFHSLALLGDGTLVAWGNNDFGQASVPADIGPIIRVQAGEDHTLVLFDNGSVHAWGRNHYGQANQPTGLADGRRIAAGHLHNVVLRQDGTIAAWGNNSAGQTLVQEDFANVVAVSAWENHTVALRRDGTVFWWGANSASGIEPDRERLRDIVAVAAGRAHGLALRANGTVVGWGDNLYGQATPPADLRGVVAVAAGEFHSLALRNDGTVTAWGNNFRGQVNVPQAVRKIVAIAAGQEHSIALDDEGSVFAWGDNFYNQLDVPSDMNDGIDIAAGSYHNIILRRDGTMAGWGSNFFDQTTVPRGLSGVVALDASRSHTVAIRENRTAVGWGSNHYGQSTIPNNITPVLHIAAGGARTVMVTGALQPPRMFGDFESRLVSAGEDVFIMPLVTGSPPLLYQWMRDGRPIEGANGPALALSNLGAADSATYSLILANSVGNVSSRSFSIEVEDPAVQVTMTPRVAVIGGRASFTARAHGTGPFTYQWFRNGEPIPLAEESSLILASVQQEDTGIYTVEVSGHFTTTTSEPMNFLIAPQIQSFPPESVAARVGERTALQMTASGSPPLEVQWFYDGQPIEGATEPTLVLQNVSVENSGVYSAVISNAAGRVISDETTLSIVPHIMLQPESQIFSAFGGNAVFEIRATGTPPLTYHWHKDGVPLAETEDPRLVLQRVRADDAGDYNVVVSNPVGRVTSDVATLMIPPDIRGHPRSQTVRAGESVEMTVRAMGGRPFEYQWSKDGNPIPGAQESRLQFDAVDGADAGRYTVTVTNPVGRATSQPGSLFVSPTITRHPEERAVSAGERIILNVEAAGGEPLFYQWAKNGSPLVDANTASLTIDRAADDDGGHYSVIVTNAAGIAISDIIEIRVE